MLTFFRAAFILMLSFEVMSGPCDKPSSNEVAADLDRLFTRHSYVFVARVEEVLRPGVLAGEDVRETTKLFVFQPPLKGTVPSRWSLELGKRCLPDFSEGAVYLVFSNDLSQPPTPSDVRVMLAYSSGPYVEWIAEWVADKHRDEPMLQDLAELEWTKRLLIVGGPAASRRVLEELRRRSDEVDERDLVWWLALDGELHSNYPGRLSLKLKQLLLEGGLGFENAVALIGKDGGVKLDRRFFQLDRVFARIDSMPMRAREMGEP